MMTASCLRAITIQEMTDSALFGVAAVSAASGVVLTTIDPLTGTGYLLFGLATGGMAMSVRQLRMAKTIASAANTLQAENDELSATNDELQTNVTRINDQANVLRRENERLMDLESRMKEDIDVLRNIVGAVGEKGDDILKRLHALWKSYEAENLRHSSLLSAQYRLHLMQIVQHFDKDTDARLSDKEMQAAEAYLQAAFPEGDIQAVKTMANSGVSLADLERYLLVRL